MQVVARHKNDIDASKVIFLSRSIQLNWIVIIPFDAVHASFRVFSDFFKKTSCCLFNWVKLFIFFISAFVVGQYTLEVFTVLLSIYSDQVLDVFKIILLLFWVEKGFHSEGKAVVVFIQINCYSGHFIFDEVGAYIWVVL